MFSSSSEISHKARDHKRKFVVRCLKNNKMDDDGERLALSSSASPSCIRSPVAKQTQLRLAFEECRKLGVMDGIKSAMRDSYISINISVVESREEDNALDLQVDQGHREFS
jgi:hypothetical protein